MTAPIFGICRHRIPIDGEGVTTLVTFSHCPLHCQYCLNPQCQDSAAILHRFTPKQLFDEVRIDSLYFLATGGGITFGGGEPCLRSDFIEEFHRLLAADSDARQWRITIETSLAVPQHHIQHLASFVDQWIIDVKDMHPDIYENYTQSSAENMFCNLTYLADLGLQSRCHIRVPLIPGFNTPALQVDSQRILEEMGFADIELFRYIKKNNG